MALSGRYNTPSSRFDKSPAGNALANCAATIKDVKIKYVKLIFSLDIIKRCIIEKRKE